MGRTKEQKGGCRYSEAGALLANGVRGLQVDRPIHDAPLKPPEAPDAHLPRLSPQETDRERSITIQSSPSCGMVKPQYTR